MIRLYHRWSYNIHRFHYAHSSTRWHHHTTPKNHGAPAPLLILAKISTHIHSIEPEWCDVEPQLLVSPGVVCRILDGKAQAHVKPGMMRLGWLRHGGTAGDSETVLKLQRSILPCDNVFDSSCCEFSTACTPGTYAKSESCILFVPFLRRGIC